MNANQIIKKTIISIWIVFIICCLGLYVYDPSAFKPENIADTLRQYNQQMILLYMLVSIIRGFSLLPSTPFVIAGTFLFSEQPDLVFWISIAGITLSSTLIYFFSDFLGFSDFFDKKFPKQIEKVRNVLNHPYGVLFIFLWSFFPLVPTDLISYVAGSMKMNFWKFIIPLFLGECVLVCSIVYFGGQLMKMFG